MTARAFISQKQPRFDQIHSGDVVAKTGTTGSLITQRAPVDYPLPNGMRTSSQVKDSPLTAATFSKDECEKAIVQRTTEVGNTADRQVVGLYSGISPL